MVLSHRRGIQPPAGFQDPLDFRQRAGVIRHMVQQMIRDDGLHGGGREGQRLGINDREGQGRRRRTEALAGVGDHPHGGIRQRDGPSPRNPGLILNPEVTRPPTEFHQATLERQPELIKHPPQPPVRIRAEPLMQGHPRLEIGRSPILRAHVTAIIHLRNLRHGGSLLLWTPRDSLWPGRSAAQHVPLWPCDGAAREVGLGRGLTASHSSS
jgi:hypothetical protein